jgi:hypothetical protein
VTASKFLAKPSWPHPLPQVIFLPAHFWSCFQLRVTPSDLFTWPVHFLKLLPAALQNSPARGRCSRSYKRWWRPLRRQLSSSYVCEYIRPIEIKPLNYLCSLVTTKCLSTGSLLCCLLGDFDLHILGNYIWQLLDNFNHFLVNFLDVFKIVLWIWSFLRLWNFFAISTYFRQFWSLLDDFENFLEFYHFCNSDNYMYEFDSFCDFDQFCGDFERFKAILATCGLFCPFNKFNKFVNVLHFSSVSSSASAGCQTRWRSWFSVSYRRLCTVNG